ncbi:DUF2251 domain-containing protein [Halopseudomonas maritima]|uniref:DUF2251 domain-containing protein n=1 Tax=Halopseudomonas maritima TaxID=2918528 RepID=UPI001EEBC524|nr:DUF2251 domain-containing protein [Halopseudomonas maritima]
MADESMIYAETQFSVGTETVLESRSPVNSFAVVFEDDGSTGYFYGLDVNQEGNPILDALHIYNVDNISDKHLPSEAQIVWSGDGNKSLLLINGYPHAAFNFLNQRGYCRTNFPPPDERWTQHSHEWADEVLALF